MLNVTKNFDHEVYSICQHLEFLFTESPTTDQLEEFVGEIATMKKVGKHPNVVRLLGFCTVEQPLMMIMEFVPCGDLVGIIFCEEAPRLGRKCFKLTEKYFSVKVFTKSPGEAWGEARQSQQIRAKR